MKCNILSICSSLKHVYIPFIKILSSFCFQVETTAVALLLEGVQTLKEIGNCSVEWLLPTRLFKTKLYCSLETWSTSLFLCSLNSRKGEVLPYMAYMEMCRWTGYDF